MNIAIFRHRTRLDRSLHRELSFNVATLGTTGENGSAPWNGAQEHRVRPWCSLSLSNSVCLDDKLKAVGAGVLMRYRERVREVLSDKAFSSTQ